MTKTNKFRAVYKTVLSVSIILSGICLIVGSIYIFYSGNGYSRQIVENVFSKINIPIYLCLMLVIGDIVWEFLSPSKKEKKFVKKDNIPSQQSAQINKNSKFIRLIFLSLALALLIFGFLTGGYADVLTKAVNICTECIGLG